MKLSKILLALALLALMVGVAYVGQAAESVGDRMTEAAERFLSTLPTALQRDAQFAFDDKERVNWHFVPLQDGKKLPTRKGLRLEKMSSEQRKAALLLLRAGTSDDGYAKATTIMSLEAILHDLETDRKSVV